MGALARWDAHLDERHRAAHMPPGAAMRRICLSDTLAGLAWRLHDRAAASGTRFDHHVAFGRRWANGAALTLWCP